MKKTIIVAITLFITVVFMSCEESGETPTPTNPTPSPTTTTGTLLLKFDNIVGNQDLKRNFTYINPVTNEDFQVYLCNYFISNVKLKTTEGKEYAVPQDESYFLVSEGSEESQNIKIPNVPFGSYSEITFTIGIDSTRSAAGLTNPPKGLLSGVNQGMYWSWNTGYIFFMFEGTSSLLKGNHQDGEDFMYHIGGYSGAINNIRKKTYSLSTKAVVSATSTPEIGFKTDLLKVFNGKNQLRIAKNSVVMFDPYSVEIMANIEQAISLDNIKNP